jgi:hypothetical protein
MPANPPVDFQKLAQGPRGATNADYPFAIRATDLNKNFVFATLDIEPGLYSETTGMQGHRQRRLRLKPGTAAGQLMQWTGEAWEALPTPTNANTLLVWNGTAWIASGAPTTAGQLLVWNGTAWTPLPAPTNANTLLIWTGTAWTSTPAPPATGTFVLGAVGGVVQWLETEGC